MVVSINIRIKLNATTISVYTYNQYLLTLLLGNICTIAIKRYLDRTISYTTNNAFTITIPAHVLTGTFPDLARFGLMTYLHQKQSKIKDFKIAKRTCVDGRLERGLACV